MMASLYNSLSTVSPGNEETIGKNWAHNWTHPKQYSLGSKLRPLTNGLFTGRSCNSYYMDCNLRRLVHKCHVKSQQAQHFSWTTVTTLARAKPVQKFLFVFGIHFIVL